MDESGKEMLLVMPPFLEKKKKSEFTQKETEQTYNIASEFTLKELCNDCGLTRFCIKYQ